METDDQEMGEPSKGGFLFEVLNNEEYQEINEGIRSKLESAIQERIGNILVKEALHLSSKREFEDQIQSLQTEVSDKLKEIEDFKVKWDAATTEISSLQNQLKQAEEDVKNTQEECKKMKYEWQDFKTQRDLAVDEKESLLTMIERRNAELFALKEEKVEISRKLDGAIKSKMAAIENSQEVESLRISLEYKEKRIEQEVELLRKQVETLSEELEDKTVELLNLRRAKATQSVNNESELATKTEELRIALETIADLKATNEKLTERAEELLEKLTSQRESYDIMMDNFHQELSAQTKLAQLYKDLCEENDSKTEKLTDSIQELKKLLSDAGERYAELEIMQKEKVLQLEHEIEKRDECIQHLKKELQDANDLLAAAKQENLEGAMGVLSPCAAAASRLLKSGMSVTQIYTQYARVSEELELEKEENRRLNLYVTTIVNEIEKKAPLLHQQRLDYEKAVASVDSLTKEMDKMISESQILSQECAEAKKTSGHLTRENERLKKELADLARQVCYLVKTVEEARGCVVTHGMSHESFGGNAQDIISKHLVTFATIEDLQENNQKLLALVRQLSEKQEAVESVSSKEYHELQMQKEKLDQRVSELLEEMGRQTRMLDLIKSQSATYRKLYNQAMGNEAEDPISAPSTPLRAPPGSKTSTPIAASEESSKKLEQAKEKIHKLEEEVASLKKNIKESTAETNKKIESLNAEIKDWMYKNSKLVAQAEYNEEKSKVLDANFKMAKKQIDALEKRNKAISEICAKHEQTLIVLKDQAMEAQTKLARAEVQRDNLQQEVFLLKTAEARLTKEREALNRERMNSTLLMNNLDGLKAALDRSEAEGKFRLEVQLGDALKECSALRNTLREEKDRFKELANSLERQTNLAKERMLEEKALAEKARSELDGVKAELEAKTQAVLELNGKIRELNNQPVRSVIESVSSNFDVSAKRVKELEKQVSELENEVARLQIQLSSAQTNSKQYAELAEAAETQLQSLITEHHSCSQSLIDKEKEWAAKVTALETKLRQTEENLQSLKADGASRLESNATNVQEVLASLKAVKDELEVEKEAVNNGKREIESLTKEISAAKEEINNVKMQLVEAENRYSQEVVLHSQAIQSLNAVQEKVNEVSAVENELRRERDAAIEALQAKTTQWEEQKKLADEEMQNLNDRVKDLDEQNRLLHDTLQKLNNDLSLLQAKVSDQGDSSEAMDTSLDISLNTSSDLSNKAQEQLLKVIKYLRQEKDIARTRAEVLQAEATRLKAQVALLQKQLDESNNELKKAKENTDSSQSASSKHAELLRKVESLNAVTDSNRLLREERNRLKVQLDELKEKSIKNEEGVEPLRNEIKQLKEKLENLLTENQALTADVNRWKARSAQLSERTKASPEEWRRLTNERDSLVKQLTAEKTNCEKLEENLKKAKLEMGTVSDQMSEVKKSLLNERSEVQRISQEVKDKEQKLSQSEEENNNLKTQVKKLTDDITKATEDATAKEAVLADMRSKDIQIKKIAKKYKGNYEELLKTVEEERKKRAEEDAKKEEEAQKVLTIPEEEQERLRAEGRNELTPQLTEVTDKVMQLQALITSTTEETEKVKQDNEALRNNMKEKDERTKKLMNSVRIRMAQLTERNKALEEELNSSRGNADQSRNDNDSKLNALKATYDAKIARLEKERTEQIELAHQERERMANEIQTLNQRISQMQRSLDKPKPSTSTQPVQKSTMEPPTANIKPMAGSSTQRKQKSTPTQQLVGPFWSCGNETPFASIRPVQTRTMAVQPTSVGGGATGASIAAASAVPLVPPQQVHTTGTSGEALSSSPTSSHTDYMPATSSALPIRVVVAPTPLNAQSTQEVEEIDLEPVCPPPQTVAMVVPRVEAAAGSPGPGPSSSAGQASSSNTVTTTQAGLKRQRDVEGESSTTEGDHAKASPQSKRTRVSGSGQSEVFHQVTHSEVSEVEYQVPTSSQRDQEDDMAIMLVDSEDDGNADEGEVEEPDDGFEEEDNGGSYEGESYSRDAQDIGNYEEGPDIDEENAADGGSNEVEIIEDSNEVPVAVPVGQEQQQQSSEATSSGNHHGSDHVVVSHAASSQSFRTRSVPPLNRAQPSLQGYEEAGDDSIVPSTPTLFLPRRSDGFGEAVSSPQVPHQRFTFSEPIPGTSRRDESAGDDPGTGRSVPTTPLVASPQDACQDQAEPSVPASVPHVPPTVCEVDLRSDPSVAQSDDDMRAPEVEELETVNVEDDNDGVTSEGEKPPAAAGELIEEGREAEASEPIPRLEGTARRGRQVTRRTPSRRTPILWNEPGSSGLPSTRSATRGQARGRGRRNWQ